VVSQHCGNPLSSYISKQAFDLCDIKRFAFQILTALKELHQRKIVHRNLSTDNILVQENKDIKLFNYGLYHITGCGQLVSFPVM
jgi:TBC domain-containing protein kinase-like protein